MGQEVAVTALQLARVVAVVANGGMLVRPHLVTRIVEPDGSTRLVAAPQPVRVLSQATARALSDILVGVVERGTGTQAAIPGFRVAGKTGTAQKAGVGGYQPGRHVPNFVGFAPAESPRVVAVVVIEEPQGKYYAAEVAAPVFAKVVSQALGILRVAPREQTVPAAVVAADGRRCDSPMASCPRADEASSRRRSLSDWSRAKRPMQLASQRAKPSLSSASSAFPYGSRETVSSSPRTRRRALRLPAGRFMS